MKSWRWKMKPASLMSKKFKSIFKRYIIFIAVILVTLNGMIPASLPVYAVEKTGMEDLEQPIVSKDIDGEETKDIPKGDSYHYHVNVKLPQSISGYESIKIEDELDKRLSVQETAILIEGKKDDTLKAETEGQKVSFQMSKEEIEKIAGKEIKLQITAQVMEDAAAGETIENVAQIVMNGNVVIETNPAVVTPIDAGSKSAESESVEEITEHEKEKEVKKVASKASSEEANAKNIAIANSNAMAADTDNKWLTHKFDGFSSDTFDQWFAVNGSAGITEDFIRLTPAQPLQSGAVFSKNKACPINNYSFSTAFSFQMRNPSPAGPSDGLTFTIQTGTSSQNVDGGGLGYYGIKPSFAVKYDTFLNDVYKDPSTNYIGLAENGTVVNQTGWFTDLDQYNTDNGTNYVLSNGTMYYTWIDYDGVSQNIQVRLGTSPDRANSKVVLSVNNIDLGAIFGGQPIHAGFTASTGYPNYENHDIHSWYFVNDFAPISTLNPQNDYKQAPSSVELTTAPSDKPGEYNVTATLLDPLGNPVQGASLDTLTATSGELTGPNGEPITELVSDAEGKIHAVLKNADYSKDTTISATVGCDTVTETIPASDEPPVDPPDACAAPVALVNGSFEEPPARMPGDKGSPGSEHAWQYFQEHEVPGWKTTASDKFIQIMKSEFIYNGMEINPPHGNQYAELNAEQVSALYQDVETTPGQTIYWRLAHKGLLGVDTMAVQIGSADTPIEKLPVIEEISTGNTEWVYYSGSYTVPAGQTTTRFAFNSIDAAGGNQRFGNLLDDIFLGTEPCVTAEICQP